MTTNLIKLSVLHLLLLLTLLFFGTSGCGKKPDVLKLNVTNNKDFAWKENLSAADVPNFPVKGFLKGNEVSFTYIVFEKWSGSNDNDINFSIVKPSQPCGYVENYQGFQLLNKGNEIEQGEWVKSGFSDGSKTYQCYYVYKASDGSMMRSSDSWNCVLKIESLTGKTVSG